MQIQIKCLDKFKPLIIKKKRVKILVGGRASTKSTFVADYVAACMANGQLWCCGREFQNSIDESVHRLLADEIERLEVAGFTINKTDISHVSGGRNFYKGLGRNILSLKGILSGVDGLWIEEGEGLSADTLRVMTGSVRTTAKEFDQAKKLGIPIDQMKTPEIWITMNRGSRSDPIAKKYLERAEPELERCGYYEDDGVMIVEANYSDIPRSWFLASGLEAERADDELNMTRQQYDHKWLGKYLETIDNAIIQPEWFDACVDAHKKLGFEPLGVEQVIHDPADSGDAKGLVYRHGSVVKEAKQKNDGDVNSACDWATGYANQVKADEFVWDADGIGNPLKRQVGEAFKGKKVTLTAFNGSGAVDKPEEIYQPVANEQSKPKTNKQTFKNRRAQRYWGLRDKIYRTFLAVTQKKYTDPADMISFSSDMECLSQLRTELCRIPLKDNGQGLIQILSKPEMKRLGIPSPNLADCVMMSEEGGKVDAGPVIINFDGYR
ncbi:phage terminase large subunit [Gilvimarinus chinensis]|uniref:phage terminase large subunit n=1 Tax=Gilvimarinus chinensis TaxID=396005 RepID=UPI00037670B1|nr:phage terminase large subunit [Gilvimarinus chinensis]